MEIKSEHHLTPAGWVTTPQRPADAVGTWMRQEGEHPSSDKPKVSFFRVWADESIRDVEICRLLAKFPASQFRKRTK